MGLNEESTLFAMRAYARRYRVAYGDAHDPFTSGILKNIADYIEVDMKSLDILLPDKEKSLIDDSKNSIRKD